jgi:hypothetical protein
MKRLINVVLLLIFITPLFAASASAMSFDRTACCDNDPSELYNCELPRSLAAIPVVAAEYTSNLKNDQLTFAYCHQQEVLPRYSLLIDKQGHPAIGPPSA